MNPLYLFVFFLLYCVGIVQLSAQNEIKEEAGLAVVLGAERMNKLQSHNPALYSKLLFDTQEGWSVKPVTEKWSKSNQTGQLDLMTIKDGSEVLQLLLEGTISRHPKRTKLYLLGNGKEVLVLHSVERQTKAFNNRRKK